MTSLLTFALSDAALPFLDIIGGGAKSFPKARDLFLKVLETEDEVQLDGDEDFSRYLQYLRQILVCLFRHFVDKEFEDYLDEVVELIQRTLYFVSKSNFSIFSLLVNNVGGLLLATCKDSVDYPTEVQIYLMEDVWQGLESTPTKKKYYDDDDDDDDDDSYSFQIPLTDESDGDVMQERTLEVLQPFLDQIVDSQPRLLSVVWESIGFCLEKGVVPAKIRALDAAGRILLLDGLPEAHLADYVVNVIFDLVYFLFENQSCEESDDEFRRELCEMESHLASCLDAFIHIRRRENQSILSFPPAEGGLAFYHKMIIESLRTSLCDHSLRHLTSKELKSSICRLLADIFDFERKRGKTPGNVFHLIKSVVHLQIFPYLVKCISDEAHGGDYLIPMLSSAVFESLEYFSAASMNANDLPSQLATASSQRVTQGDVPLYVTASNQYDRLYGKLQHHVDQVFGLLDELTSASSSQLDPSPTFAILRRRLRSISVILGVVSACLTRQRWSRDASSLDAMRKESDATGDVALKLWVSDSVVTAIVKLYLQLFSYLTECTAGGQLDVANEFFGLSVTTIGDLLKCLFGTEKPSGLVQQSVSGMARILLIPWIQRLKSMFPMDKDFEGPIYNFSKALCGKIFPEHLGACLSALPLLPARDYLDLRGEVLALTLLQEPSADSRVLRAAITSLPLYLAREVPESFRNYVIFSLLTPSLGELPSFPAKIREEFPRVFGECVCAFVDCARPRVLPNDESPEMKFQVACVFCDEDGNSRDTRDINYERTNHDLKWAQPFCALLDVGENSDSHPSASTRQAFVSALRRIFNHVRLEDRFKFFVEASINSLADPDYGVRMALAHLVPQMTRNLRLLKSLLKSKDESSSVYFCDMDFFTEPSLVDPILDTLKKMQQEHYGDPGILSTILCSTAKYGSAFPGGPPENVLKILLTTLTMTKDPIVAANASRYLDDALGHDPEVAFLAFRRHQEELCDLLIKLLYGFVKEEIGDEVADAAVANKSVLENPIYRAVGEECLMRIQGFAAAVGFKSSESFARNNQRFLVPCLIKHKGDDVSHVILQQFGKLLGTKGRKEVIINNFKNIFAHMILHEGPDEYSSILSYIANTTEIELTSFIKMNIQQIRNLLLIRMCSHPSHVYRGLRVLMRHDTTEFNERTLSDEAVANYLGPNLHGTFFHFDNLIRRADVLEESKREVIQSLTFIVDLMGQKHITPHRVKLMTMLKNGLAAANQNRTLLALSRAWNTFVRNVRLADLGKILVEVTIHLLPLLERHPDPAEVGSIYYFLIVENEEPFKDTLSELFFLMEAPLDESIKICIRRSKDGNGVEAEIKGLLKGVSHENKDVRIQTLKQLLNLLIRRRAEIQTLISGNEVADSIISKLVSSLHNGCQATSDRQIRLGLSKCLGELGAIDPGKLDLHNDEYSSRGKILHDLPKHVYDVKETDVQVAIMNELVQAYLAAEDTVIQDRAAYAIQESIKVMKLGSKSAGFSPDAQEVLKNHETSCYTQNKNIDPKQYDICPMYGSRLGSSFRNWICNLAFRIILHNLDLESIAYQTFEPCGLLLEARVECAIFFLPSLVLHSLLGGEEKTLTDISDEFIAILADVASGDSSSLHASPSDGNMALTRTASHDAILSTSNSRKDLASLAVQTVFRVLDYVRAWKNFRIEELTASQGGKKEQPHARDRAFQSIHNFYERIPKDMIAKAALASNSPTRALLYFEEYIESKGDAYNMSKHNEDLGFLLRIYNSLDEPDGVQGLDQIRRGELSLMDRIYVLESKGNHLDASVCYEEAISKDPLNVKLHLGLLKCFTKMGQLSSVLSQVEGLVAKNPGWSTDLCAPRVECAWKLNQWDRLEEFLSFEKRDGQLAGVPSTASTPLTAGKFEYNLGKIFSCLQREDEGEFDDNLSAARVAEIGPLSATAMETGSYNSGYQHVVKLQVLNELELLAKEFVFRRDSTTTSRGGNAESVPLEKLESILAHLDSRFGLMQPSYRSHDCLLNFRRTVFSLLRAKTPFAGVKRRLETEVGQSWLRFARSARLSGVDQTAFVALNHARAFDLLEFPLEQAKLLNSLGKKTEALNFLDKRISATFDKYQVRDRVWDYSSDRHSARIHAETVLLHARFNDELELSGINPQVMLYQFVTQLKFGATWEKAFYLTGNCIRKHLKRQEETGGGSGRCNLIAEIFKNYLLCLKYGSQFFYQTLPFVFEKWFELASTVTDHEEKLEKNQSQYRNIQAVKEYFIDITKNHIKTITDMLQPYQLLVVFPQLISRICHSNEEVSKNLTKIIVHVMKEFPQQTFWHMMQVSNSSSQRRRQRYEEITAVFMRTTTEENRTLLKTFSSLSDQLIKICQHKVESGSGNVLSLTQSFRPLEKMMKSPAFPQIILPFKDSLYPMLPNDTAMQNRDHCDHRPFPTKTVYIKSLNDEIEVLKSLQKPKKVKIRGTDGKTYNLLCKAEDDLRKDYRFLEFNGIVNKCLRKNPSTRQKELYIRTFAVIPLSEKAGLVEWIPNLMPLRQIILKLHRETGTGLTSQESGNLVVAWNKAPAGGEERKRAFHKLREGFAPPIFHRHFPRAFSEPSQWYRARTNYARTTAVMSMVGFVVGLGDRHGENILCDVRNGDAVHVDFDCLFLKGETLKVPENVPFRLTQNVVDGFGPMGIEGVFRCACEATLRVMREEQDALLSAMTAFLYDPLVEWTRVGHRREAPSKSVPECGEFKENSKAVEMLQNLKQRLRGEGKKRRGMPLSVEGQVQELLKDAADLKKLELMFIGWAPYL